MTFFLMVNTSVLVKCNLNSNKTAIVNIFLEVTAYLVNLLSTFIGFWLLFDVCFISSFLLTVLYILYV